MIKKNEKNIYYIYILECENGILYTGITTDYKRRLDEHKNVNSSNKGAKFTKSHKPEKIVALWKTSTRSDASKLEARIKQLTKIEKIELIGNNKMFKLFFSEVIDCSVFRRLKISNTD